MEESSGPTVKCLNCEREIAMAVIKLHHVSIIYKVKGQFEWSL